MGAQWSPATSSRIARWSRTVVRCFAAATRTTSRECFPACSPIHTRSRPCEAPLADARISCGAGTQSPIASWDSTCPIRALVDGGSPPDARRQDEGRSAECRGGRRGCHEHTGSVLRHRPRPLRHDGDRPVPRRSPGAGRSCSSPTSTCGSLVCTGSPSSRGGCHSLARGPGGRVRHPTGSFPLPSDDAIRKRLRCPLGQPPWAWPRILDSALPPLPRRRGGRWPMLRMRARSRFGERRGPRGRSRDVVR